ncbi:unnamed protein product, partial [Urochloa humidicola]
GSLTLCRALVQALCYPLATCATARQDRARVVAAGAFLWTVATLLVGASGTFLQVCTASTVPLAAVLLLGLPDDPAVGAAYAAAFFVLGFAMPWCPVS